jgi:hypothetical protein
LPVRFCQRSAVPIVVFERTTNLLSGVTDAPKTPSRSRNPAVPPNGAVAFNPTEWYAFGDHSPIVATFED